MQIYRDLGEAAGRLGRSVVTIGNFDGVHIGHQAIFGHVVGLARERGAAAVALTFEPHPVAFFAPEKAPFRLTPGEQKFEVMGEFGLDAVVAMRFDAGVAGMTPREFVEEVLHGALEAEHVVVGEGFRFGAKRAGTTEMMAELGQALGMSVEVCEPVRWEGEIVSSTRVREAITDGAMQDVSQLLGRPYRILGEVVHGDARGRALGFPTANIESENALLPPDGVYATRLHVEKMGALASITNIGRRPTFGGGDRVVETFILTEKLDPDLDLYGQQVGLELLDFVRPEKKFDSPKELIAQITEDIAHVRAYLLEQES